ncbi:MAG TPA: transposase [Nitrospirota bacterium]|nr:transposase [Nitrospirota bacterium]
MDAVWMACGSSGVPGAGTIWRKRTHWRRTGAASAYGMRSPCVFSATLSAIIAIIFPGLRVPEEQNSTMDNHRDACKSTALSSDKERTEKGYHLITLVTNRRARLFASRELAIIATEVILLVEKKKSLRLRGFIVMPDHIHIICEPMKSLDQVIRDIKKLISLMSISHLSINDRNMLKSIETPGGKPLFRLWRRAYHHARIPTERLIEALRYLYEHPVRSGICSNAFEYEFSDIHRHPGSGARTDPDRPYPFLAEKPGASAFPVEKITKDRPGPASVS